MALYTGGDKTGKIITRSQVKAAPSSSVYYSSSSWGNNSALPGGTSGLSITTKKSSSTIMVEYYCSFHSGETGSYFMDFDRKINNGSFVTTIVGVSSDNATPGYGWGCDYGGHWHHSTYTYIDTPGHTAGDVLYYRMTFKVSGGNGAYVQYHGATVHGLILQELEP
jgi:hypothetical protein|tara:strand:- start:357 stop:854 length:498 start_codon:yes stop_codon:yes gene_type:complete